MPEDEYTRLTELRESRPEWLTWRGVGGLYYAYHQESRKILSAADLTELITLMDQHEERLRLDQEGWEFWI